MSPCFDRADQRISEHQVDVIANQHQIARLPEAVHAARGVRDDQRSRAERVNDAHRKAGEADIVALVHVKPAGERDDELSRERAGDQRPGVAGDGRRRKARECRETESSRSRSISSASPPSPEPSTMRDLRDVAAEPRSRIDVAARRAPRAAPYGRITLPRPPPSAAISARRASDQLLALLPGQERARESVQRDLARARRT